jgi:protoheme ferro-lyase
MTVLTKIDEYLSAREFYEGIHEQSQKAHKAMRAAEYELVNEMLDEGTNNVGLDTGIHVNLRKQFTCSVTVENEDRIREWLTEKEGDDARFVHEKVNKPAFVEWLREEILEKQQLDESDVPEFVKLTSRPSISLRGWSTRDRSIGEEI